MTEHRADQTHRLIDAVASLIDHVRTVERERQADLERVAPDYRGSARNLVHYLAVRQLDLRELQERLSTLGMSSLGRMEAHVMATLSAVLSTLRRLADPGVEPHDLPESEVGFRTGPLLLQDHARLLLGAAPPGRDVRIMVTMPSEAASDPSIIARLLASGMNVMRVNCAHDGPEAWHAMLDHLDRAKRDLKLPCRVLADLAGPKLRTGMLAAGPAVARIKPQRDVRGRVTRRAKIWLTAAATPEEPDGPVDQVLLVEGADPAGLATGDHLRLVDTRGRRRRLGVVERAARSCLVESDRTLYVENGLEFAIHRAGTDDCAAGSFRVVGLPPLPSAVDLHLGDRLVVTRASEAEAPPDLRAAPHGSSDGRGPARLTCSLPAVFESAKSGEPIWFDDGTIGGRIEDNDGERLTVVITQVPPRGARLRSEKGINLPATQLAVPALTPHDLDCLGSLAERIDMVGLSFVRAPEDVLQLEDHLHLLDAERLGIVLKIENRMAFERLPRMLLAGMRSPPIGVMVARGDLAVEVGYDRLAEVQEEILWMCEAAHVPVIWATQVLESLATRGAPTRAEVTDAAMSGRAECVMLNKGPYIVNAVEFLSGVLERMAAHQVKKSAMLRHLAVSRML